MKIRSVKTYTEFFFNILHENQFDLIRIFTLSIEKKVKMNSHAYWLIFNNIFTETIFYKYKDNPNCHHNCQSIKALFNIGKYDLFVILSREKYWLVFIQVQHEIPVSGTFVSITVRLGSALWSIIALIPSLNGQKN